jgi:hypothetical protein
MIGEALEQMTPDMVSLREEKERTRREASGRNEPLEEVLCNTHPTLLHIPEVSQMYNLLYRLENF